MKKGLFRICGLFLCLALILSCLTACGGSNSTNSGSSATATGAKWQDDKIELYVIASGTPRIFQKSFRTMLSPKVRPKSFHEAPGRGAEECPANRHGQLRERGLYGLDPHKTRCDCGGQPIWLAERLVVKKGQQRLL